MATTTKRKTIVAAFRIDIHDIKAIWQIISERELEQLDVRFDCSDGTTIRDNSINSLLTFPNANARRIYRIEFDNGITATPHITVTITDRGIAFGPRIEYSVAGEDKDVIYICDKLDHVIANTTLWYSVITGISLSAQTLIIMICSIVVLYLVVGSFYTTFFMEGYQSIARIGSVVGLFLAIAIVVVWKFISRVFPPLIIGVGGGIIRANRARFIRQLLGTVVIFRLIINIVAAYIYGYVH